MVEVKKPDFRPNPVMQEMDSAAVEAENNLADVSNEAIIEIGKWWNKWYMKAGHKRLGRVLNGYYKELSSAPAPES